MRCPSVATRPLQGNDNGDSDGTQRGEEDGDEHGYHMPAPTAGLEGQANQEEGDESEQDEAPAANDWGAGAAENDGRAPLQTSEIWDGAPAARAASKKLERLGNKHGLELDDRLAELLRYGAVPWFVQSTGAGCFLVRMCDLR